MTLEFDKLIQPAREGDAQALGQLLAIYRNYVEFIARPQIKGRLSQKFSASDLAQETFVKVKECIARFRGETEAEFIVWLRKIVAQRLAEFIRHYGAEQRNLKLEVDLQSQFDQSSASLGQLYSTNWGGPRSHAIRQEAAVLLANALANLPEDHREVLTLRHVQGLPFAEVATEMGRSIHSVKNLWARAIKTLRDRLGEAGR